MTHDTAALTRAWPMVCQLIGLAQLYLSRLSPSGGARWALYRITRLAESLVRRWLVLSACQDGAWMFEPAPEPQSVPVHEDAPFNPERLRDRIAALTAVMEAPERHVRRMARWLARAAGQRARGAGRLLPLGVGWPAGTSRAAKKRDPQWVSMVLYLDRLAHEAVVRCGSP